MRVRTATTGNTRTHAHTTTYIQSIRCAPAVLVEVTVRHCQHYLPVIAAVVEQHALLLLLLLCSCHACRQSWFPDKKGTSANVWLNYMKSVTLVPMKEYADRFIESITHLSWFGLSIIWHTHLFKKNSNERNYSTRHRRRRAFRLNDLVSGVCVTIGINNTQIDDDDDDRNRDI